MNRTLLGFCAVTLAVMAVPPSANREVQLLSRRILVVDDTKAAGYVLSKLLEKLGQNVRATENPAAALSLVQAEPFDVVISDIAMPAMDGYELARQLRCKPESQNMVLVALTGFGQDSDRQRAKDAGFDFHLVKPVSFESLQNLLASLPAPRPSSQVALKS